MLKRILVALSGDSDIQVAPRYAQVIGDRSGAEITRLSVLDAQAVSARFGHVGQDGHVGHIAHVGRAGDAGRAAHAGDLAHAGHVHYAERSRARKMVVDRDPACALVRGIDEALAETSVPHVDYVSDRVPYKRTAEEMKYHDMLVIGRDPHPFASKFTATANTLARIVKHGISPALVVPEEYRAVERVLVAYDGSDSAARTIQKFAQLQPFGTWLMIDIVHVRSWVGDHFTKRSERRLAQAADFFADHGFGMVQTTSLEPAEPQIRLPEYARECEADLIVAGAHSVSAVHRSTFGSTTRALLAERPVPLFLFH